MAQSNQVRRRPAQPLRDPAEFLLDTCPCYGSGFGSDCNPGIASDGANYLVVWETDCSEEIRATRVTPAGEILDACGILLASCCYPEQSRNPRVAFDGANYLVVWEQGPSYDATGILGVRVSPAGEILDSSAIPVCAAVGHHGFPVLASGDSIWFVAWSDSRNSGSAVYGARVNRAGAVLDPDGIVIAGSNPDLSQPSGIAFDGANFLAVWAADVDTLHDCAVFAARLSPEGTVLDPDGFRISRHAGTQHPCAVAFDGTEYFVTWQAAEDTLAGLYGSFVAPDQAVRDPQGVVITRTCSDCGVTSAGFDGTNYFVTWDDTRQPGSPGRLHLYGARVSPSGSVLDTGIALATAVGSGAEAAIGSDPGGFAVVFSGKTPCNYSEIEVIRVGHDGSVRDSASAVSLLPNLQYYPAAASDGADYLTVWLDYRRSGCADIYAMRVSSTGTLLDSESFLVARTRVGGGLTLPPAVGFDGTDYLVTWSDLSSDGGEGCLYARRISPGGALLDTGPVLISSAANSLKVFPAVAFDGTDCFVTWTDWPGSGAMQVYGARITPAGAVLDPQGIPVSVGTGMRGFATSAFDGTNYLVTWIDERTGEDDIRGARVTRDGAVLDPDGIPVSVAPGNQWYPSASFDGRNYLVTWSDGRNGSDFDLYAARVTSAGAVLDPPGFPVAAGPRDQMYSAVGFDGASHVVLYSDGNSGDLQMDIRGARVSPEGTVVDTFPVAVESNNQFWPRIALGHARSILLTYAGWADEIQGRPCGRVRAWGKLGPFGGLAENPVSPCVDRLGLEVSPNPVTDAALVNYTLPSPGNVTLRLYDVAGRLVSTLVSGYHAAGSYSYSLLTTHCSLAAGVYLLSQETGRARKTLKLVIE